MSLPRPFGRQIKLFISVSVFLHGSIGVLGSSLQFSPVFPVSAFHCAALHLSITLSSSLQAAVFKSANLLFTSLICLLISVNALFKSVFNLLSPATFFFNKSLVCNNSVPAQISKFL